MSQIISIKHNFPEVAAKLSQLRADVGNKAVVRALNTTVTQGKTQMARSISQEYRIGVGQAKDRLDVRRAIAKGANIRFEAVLEAKQKRRGRSMNLIAFVTGNPRKTKKGRGEVKLQIRRAGGRKVIAGAFVGNKGRTLFIRSGKERLPIRPLSTIDIPQMFNAKTINGAVRKVMIDRFGSNFDRELRSVLKGYVK